MSDRERQALMLWDFGHSKKRPKVYVEGRWRNECQCGEVFLTLQGWEDHRIDEGVAMVREALRELVERNAWEHCDRGPCSARRGHEGGCER